MRRGTISSPLPERERIEGEGPYPARFFARESRFLPSFYCSCATKNFIDHAQNFPNTRQDLGVPESKNPVALRLEKRSPGFIFLRTFNVLCTIQFNDEASFSRAEISEVGTNRMLTPEFGATHLPGSQMVPNNSLRVGLLATQPSCVLLGRFDRAHRFRMFASSQGKTSTKRNRILSRALNEARCKRTLSFILSLTGRGNRNGDSAVRQHFQNEIANLVRELIFPSFSQGEILGPGAILQSPLPVRERIKVRVLIQRASFARESRFFPFQYSFN